jgi:hypothetical protein
VPGPDRRGSLTAPAGTAAAAAGLTASDDAQAATAAPGSSLTEAIRPCCVPGLPGRAQSIGTQVGDGYYCVSRMTIDSGGRVMPWASEDELVVPWTMVESVAFWFAAV